MIRFGIILPLFAVALAFLAGGSTSYILITRGGDIQRHAASTARGQMEMADIKEWRSFEDFPLFWLGEEFEGLPLTDVIRTVRPADPSLPHPSAQNQLTLIYGTCDVPPGSSGGCAVPLAIIIEPLCTFPWAFLPEEAKSGPAFTIRGAEAQRIGPELVLRTGEVAVSIESASGDRALEQRAAESLLSMNSQDAPSRDASLAAPAASCD